MTGPRDKGLGQLRTTLEQSPIARARFVTGLLTLLEEQGVDVNDKAVLDSLELNLDLSDGKRFVDSTTASTNIITITK